MYEKNEYMDGVLSAPDMPQPDDVVRDAFKRWLNAMDSAGKPLTQAALGRKLDWSQPEVSNYLKGKVNADLERVICIARLMGISIDALVTGSIDPVRDDSAWMAAWYALNELDRTYVLELAWRLAGGGDRRSR